MPMACSFCSITLPTPGMSPTASGARNFASSPGRTQSTPFGLALAEETLAISREVPIPIEQFSCVADCERRQKLRLLSGQNPEHAVRFGFGGGNLSDQPRGADPD